MALDFKRGPGDSKRVITAKRTDNVPIHAVLWIRFRSDRHPRPADPDPGLDQHQSGSDLDPYPDQHQNDTDPQHFIQDICTYLPCMKKYEIFARILIHCFVKVAERLNSVIEEGLEGQEYVSLLQWVEQTYPGPELMASPALGNIPFTCMCTVLYCRHSFLSGSFLRLEVALLLNQGIIVQ